MKRVYRTYPGLILSLLLVLTGQGVAASRGMSAAVGQMEICTGTGPVVVYMDAEGQPTKAPHYCPEFALSLLGALIPDEQHLPGAPERALPGMIPGRVDLTVAARPQCFARAPPVAG